MKIGNAFKTIFNSNVVKNHITKSSNDSKFLARALLATSVSKDVFAYALRVKNTLSNDKIPEDKKRYTVKIDAATCVATGLTQVGAGLLVSCDKFQNFCADKLFKSLKNSKKDFEHAKTAFGSLSTLVIASVFAKRVLTPLIAVKFADKDKKN